jgi:hypothetical protein
MRVRRCCWLLVVLVIPACKGRVESNSAPDPLPEAPTVAAGAVLRPTYRLGNAAPVSAGLAFVIQDRVQRAYLLTSTHALDRLAEWDEVQSVSLHGPGGNELAQGQGRRQHLGKEFELVNPAFDLVVWQLAPAAKVVPLPLAAAGPKQHDWVWVVGQEAGEGERPQTFRCQVSGADAGLLILQQDERFDTRGFVGAPIVNAGGEVIGVLLSGRDPAVLGSSAASIRQRLAEARIDVP